MLIRQLINLPYRLALYGLLLHSPSLLHADTSLPTVTISPGETPLSEQIDHPQILEEEELSVAHERGIEDVIEGDTGINSAKTGGYGQPALLFVRGAGGQGLVTLDDMPMLTALPGLHSLDTLPVEALQAAQIERGLGAIYRPFQALGGSVRLYTRDREQNGGLLSVEGGSFATLRETLQGGIKGSLGRMTVTMNRGDAFDGTHLAYAANNPEREPFRFTQGILRFSTDFGSRVNWQGSMVYRNSWVGLDGLGLDDHRRVAFKDDPNSFSRSEFWLAQNSLNIKMTQNWTSRWQLGYTSLDSEVKAGPFKNNLFNRIYLASLRNQHTLIENTAEKIGWQLYWGGEVRHEQAQLHTLNFAAERMIAAGYLDTEGKYRNLSGSLGVRVERFDGYGDHPLFKAAAAWRFNSQLTLRASGGTGYRIPSYTELLSLFYGNPKLRPERSASGDLGLEWMPMEGMRINLNGFYQRYDNLITQAYDTRRGPVTVNIPDAEVTGIELGGQYAWNDDLETGLSYTFNESRNLQSHQSAPLRPPHIGRIWGKQQLPGLPVSLWTEAIVRSSGWNDINNQIPVNATIRLNAAIRYAASKSLELYVRGENLANTRTAQFYSLDVPGIAVYGGFKWGI